MRLYLFQMPKIKYPVKTLLIFVLKKEKRKREPLNLFWFIFGPPCSRQRCADRPLLRRVILDLKEGSGVGQEHEAVRNGGRTQW